MAPNIKEVLILSELPADEDNHIIELMTAGESVIRSRDHSLILLYLERYRHISTNSNIIVSSIFELLPDEPIDNGMINIMLNLNVALHLSTDNPIPLVNNLMSTFRELRRVNRETVNLQVIIEALTSFVNATTNLNNYVNNIS